MKNACTYTGNPYIVWVEIECRWINSGVAFVVQCCLSHLPTCQNFGVPLVVFFLRCRFLRVFFFYFYQSAVFYRYVRSQNLRYCTSLNKTRIVFPARMVGRGGTFDLGEVRNLTGTEKLKRDTQAVRSKISGGGGDYVFAPSAHKVDDSYKYPPA